MSKKKRASRQQRWQQERRNQGLCTLCGHEKLITKNHGPKCAKKIREAARKRTGAKVRYKTCRSYKRPGKVST